MIDEMLTLTRRAVAVLVCQVGTITASTSAAVISVTGLRPSLGNTYSSNPISGQLVRAQLDLVALRKVRTP